MYIYEICIMLFIFQQQRNQTAISESVSYYWMLTVLIK